MLKMQQARMLHLLQVPDRASYLCKSETVIMSSKENPA